MGYGGGWVEMVMGRSVVVGGSAGDGRIGGGVDLCSDMFLSLFFCFGGGFGGGYGLILVVVVFFFSW